MSRARVLVPLLKAAYGQMPLHYLLQQTRADFHYILVTTDPAVAAQFQDVAETVYVLDDAAPKVPAWLRRQGRLSRIPAELITSYQAHRHWRALARACLAQAPHDLVLVLGDYEGFAYHLAHAARRPVVLPQITLTWPNLALMQDHWRTDSAAKRVATALLRGLSIITRRSLTYRLGARHYAPHGAYIGQTLGAALAGSRFIAPVKGVQADALCVNSPAAQDFFTSAGIPAARIHVTGSPSFDHFAAFRATPPDSAALRAAFGLRDDPPIISFFLQPLNAAMLGGRDYIQETARLVRGLLALSPQVVVIAKVHPRHDIAAYAAALDDPRLHWVDSRQHPGEAFNNQLVRASRLVLTRSSTVGYNALALDVPLLTFSLYDDVALEKDYMFLQTNWHVTSEADLWEAARALLFDEAEYAARLAHQQRQRDRHILVDGACCARIAQVMKDHAYVDSH